MDDIKDLEEENNLSDLLDVLTDDFVEEEIEDNSGDSIFMAEIKTYDEEDEDEIVEDCFEDVDYF